MIPEDHPMMMNQSRSLSFRKLSYKTVIFLSTMIFILVYLYFYFFIEPMLARAMTEVPKNATILRVMTFNIWYGGTKVNDGITKIAKHIKLVDPDVVAIQEVNSQTVLSVILQELGSKWTGVQGSDKAYPNNGIITKHKILENSFAETPYSISSTILINDTLSINFWGLHLFHKPDGPKAAFNKMVTKAEQILAGEMTGMEYKGKNHTGRVGNIGEILATKKFQEDLKKVDDVPLVVAGDFNTPSHLDWVDGNKHLHGGWVFEWPVTKLLWEKAGLVDSFRDVHPDPVKEPGITWSPVQKWSGPDWSYHIPEPQDRIDFILYRGRRLIPVKSYTYIGEESFQVQEKGHSPYEYPQNDWPSDHYAVVTEFIVTGI